MLDHVRHTLLCLLFSLLAANAWGQDRSALPDVTGIYRIPSPCNPKAFEDAGIMGVAPVRHCFEGSKLDTTSQLELVQNGQFVCGSYYSCGGNSCHKVYTGRMAGYRKGNILELFVEDGHQEAGEAQVQRYLVVSKGLSYSERKDKKAIYVRQMSRLISPSSAQACRPVLQHPVQLKDYRLQGAGLLKEDEIKFEVPRETLTQAPKAKQIFLKNAPSFFQWEDKRNTNNYVPRLVTVYNNTAKAWTISAEHPELCLDYLRYSASRKFNEGVSSDDLERGVEVAPGSSTRFYSCNGSTVRVDNEVACPKFSCLEGCKC
ncbi:hypothetical protein [Polaromonas sp. YR568]|uniref:hypothetical protein n=1 Tax=Polaromonas sp. YR568 TaxID=1855301 RepID=UPI003137D31D